MNPQNSQQNQDKVDLSSLNQQPKQPRKLNIANPFKKKSAGPGRDEIGRFAGGKSGLKSLKKFNWSRALPLVLIVSLVGGYLVFRSFAGTYRACASVATEDQYIEDCVTNSEEASVIRLYYGIFNRAPDSSGLSYWSDQLATKKVNTTRIAELFMGSSEFKRRYGTLTNSKFVSAMYPQVFGRQPDTAGQKYWTDQLNAKKYTRAGLMSFFTQSSEMKRNFAFTVARDLGIASSLQGKALASGTTECYGNITTDNSGSRWCTLPIKNSIVKESSGGNRLIIGNIPFSPGAITGIAESKTQIKLVNAPGKTLECSYLDTLAYSGSLTSNQATVNEPNVAGGGYGGCSSLGSAEETNYFGTGNLVDKTSGLLLNLHVSNQESLDSLPSNAAVSVKISGIEFREVTYGGERVNSFSQTNVAFQPTRVESVNIRGILYKMNYRVPYTGLQTGAEWSQVAKNKLSGKSVFSLFGATKINTYESDTYLVKFKAGVYDAITGVAVPIGNYKVQTSQLSDGGFKAVELKPNTNGEYSFNNDIWSHDEITVTTDSEFPSSYRYQVDILAPTTYKLFGSHVRPSGL